MTGAVIPELGNELGVFTKLGLKVQISDVTGGDKVLAAVTGGSLDCGVFGAPVPENAVLHGFPLQWVAIWLHRAPTVIVARKGVASLSDLRGKSVGIAGPGTLSAILTSIALNDAHIASQVTTRSFGSQGTVLSAFVAGEIDAAMFTTPLSYTAQSKSPGSTVIYDFGTSSLVWPGIGLACPESYLGAHADAVKALLKGLAQSIQAFKQDPQEAQKVIASVTNTTNPSSVSKAYNLVAPLLDTQPVPQATDEQVVLAQLAMSDSAAKNLKVSQLQAPGYMQNALGS